MLCTLPLGPKAPLHCYPATGASVSTPSPEHCGDPQRPRSQFQRKPAYTCISDTSPPPPNTLVLQGSGAMVALCVLDPMTPALRTLSAHHIWYQKGFPQLELPFTGKKRTGEPQQTSSLRIWVALDTTAIHRTSTGLAIEDPDHPQSSLMLVSADRAAWGPVFCTLPGIRHWATASWCAYSYLQAKVSL